MTGRIGLLFLGMGISLWTPPPARASESPPGRAGELVERLGDPSFRVREAASGELLRMGRAAREALATGRDDPNPEIRDRCRRLLPIALHLDLLARIDAFLADPTGPHDLPGLGRFLSVVGDERLARELYADMIKFDGQMIQSAEVGSRDFADRFRKRTQEMQQRFNTAVRIVNGTRVEPELPDWELASILFVGAAANLPKNDVSSRTLGGLFYRPGFQSALTGEGQRQGAIRKLFLHWLESRTQDYSAYQGLYTVVRTEMKEALPLAVKMLADEGATQQTRGMAMMVVGKFGDAGHVPELEKFITDDTLLTNVRINNVQATTKLGDVALAMCVHLSGQDLKEYPFDLLKTQPLNFLSSYYMGFSTDENRLEAREKWEKSKRN